MPQFANTAYANGTVGAFDAYDYSTAIVEIPAIKVDKVADMSVWHGDMLTFTITITNLDTTEDATGLTFTDTITPSLAKLVTDSVKVDSLPITFETDFSYNPTTGVLLIPAASSQYIIPVIAPGQSRTISFQVTKA